jgi:hypothetical protein
MKQLNALVEAYSASGMDSASVKAWYAENSPSAESLSQLAEGIGAIFLSRRIDFSVASGLLNQLMPLAGFESAPARFWQYYTAFENCETSSDPDTHARQAVSALTSGGAA